jgi:hypothetical protein
MAGTVFAVLRGMLEPATRANDMPTMTLRQEASVLPLCRSALSAALVLILAGPALAGDVTPNQGIAGLNKVSTNPLIIRGHLDLGVVYAQEALQRLRAAPANETPESLQRTINDSYQQLRFAHMGMLLRRQAPRNARFPNPLLDLQYEQLENAMGHIRNAWHLAFSVSPARTDIARDVTAHLEAVISIVAQVEDLI